MITFNFLKVLAQFCAPPGLLVLGIILSALLNMAGARRLAGWASGLAVLQLIVSSFNVTADALMLPLENEARALAQAAPACCYDSIVVLGAGVAMAAPPMRQDIKLTETSDRLWHAARLYHRGLAARVIVSGGSVAVAQGIPGQTEAEAMSEVLVALGVPKEKIAMEKQALNTIGNIREVQALVGSDRVALVTSAYHMPRAMRLAKKGGLVADAFPADWRVVPGPRQTWEAFVPSVDAILITTLAVREYLALAFDRRA